MIEFFNMKNYYRPFTVILPLVVRLTYLNLGTYTMRERWLKYIYNERDRDIMRAVIGERLWTVYRFEYRKHSKWNEGVLAYLINTTLIFSGTQSSKKPYCVTYLMAEKTQTSIFWINVKVRLLYLPIPTNLSIIVTDILIH